MVIDRSRMYAVKERATSTVIGGIFDSQKGAESNQKIRNAGNVLPLEEQEEQKERKDRRKAHSEDQKSESGGDKQAKHVISIGSSSFSVCAVIAVLGDSIRFGLVEVDEAFLLGEHVLTGEKNMLYP